MKAKQKWFAVKTLHRWVPQGRPVKADRSFDRGGTLVEERVLLFRAPTPSEAIQMAERAARQYAKDRFTNPYGETVVTRYLNACDCFELFDDPGNGAEVFSTTCAISKRTSDRGLCDRYFGSRSENRRPRKRYSDGEFILTAEKAGGQTANNALNATHPASRGLRGKPRATGRAR